MFFIQAKIFSQEKINVLLMVDDVVTGSFNVSDSYLIAQNDTIKLRYEMGRFEFDDKRLIERIEKNIDVSLCFKYYSSCNNVFYNYNIKLKLPFLLQDYLLIKVYNFKNYPNTFSKNTGYDREIISPLGGEALPRKKKKNRNKNICL